MDVHHVALRWLGHRQQSEMHITVDCQLTTYESHRIAEQVRQALFQKMPAMVDVSVHVDPCECDEAIEYHLTPHHRN